MKKGLASTRKNKNKTQQEWIELIHILNKYEMYNFEAAEAIYAYLAEHCSEEEVFMNELVNYLNKVLSNTNN